MPLMPKMLSSQLKASQSTPPLPFSLVTICLSSSQLPAMLPSLPLAQVGRGGGEEDVLLHTQLLQCFHVPVSTVYSAKHFYAFCFFFAKSHSAPVAVLQMSQAHMSESTQALAILIHWDENCTAKVGG